MKPNFPEDILELVAARGKAVAAIDSIPEGGMPEDAGQPETVPPVATGKPDVLPPVETGRPEVTPPVEFDEATGLPLLALDKVPDPFPGGGDDDEGDDLGDIDLLL